MFKNRGFSLTELMITTAVAALVFTGVINILIASDETVNDTVDRGELQENGRLAMQMISRDILMAGYWGPYTGKPLRSAPSNSSSPAVTLHSESDGTLPTGMLSAAADCAILDSRKTNNGSFFRTDSARHFRFIWGAKKNDRDNLLGGCIDSAQSGSDILQVKRMLGEEVESNSAFASKLTPTRYYMMARQNEAVIFAGSDSAPTFSDGTAENGVVGEYQHHVYFVEHEQRIAASDSSAGYSVPILKRKYLYKKKADTRNKGLMKTQSLVEGIEHLGFLYGIDSNDDGTVNYYAKASELENADWEYRDREIVAIKVFILVRTIQPDTRSEVATDQVYDLGSHIVTIPANSMAANNYRRILLTKTIMIMNRQNISWQS